MCNFKEEIKNKTQFTGYKIAVKIGKNIILLRQILNIKQEV